MRLRRSLLAICQSLLAILGLFWLFFGLFWLLLGLFWHTYINVCCIFRAEATTRTLATTIALWSEWRAIEWRREESLFLSLSFGKREKAGMAERERGFFFEGAI